MLTLAHKAHEETSRMLLFMQSARGLAQSRTLRVFQKSSCRAQRFGVRRPSAAFPGGILNCANVNRNCYSLSEWDFSTFSVELDSRSPSRLGAPASRRPVGSRKPEFAGETPALPGTAPRFRDFKREFVRGNLIPALISWSCPKRPISPSTSPAENV